MSIIFLKAPFLLPPDFLSTFGYRGGRRFVGLFWEPCGDEACYDDGQHSTCGCCDNWMFLNLVRHPDVRRWLDANDIHLGNSEEPAQHWLVANANTGEVYVALMQEARTTVLRQEMPK